MPEESKVTETGANAAAAPEGCLRGVRVVDLSRVLAGPYGTMILADHGADVIKIEPPSGDETRRWGPPFDEKSGGSSYYVGINRNKRAITLNLKDPADREKLLGLIKNADVLIENFKPGTMEAWDLSYETLAELFPALVYCRISGFGEAGPLGNLAGYDAVLQAMSGLMSINGTPETGPTKMGCPIVDLSTGLYSVIGILMALVERQRSGKGQFIDMTLYDCALAMLHPQGANYLMSGNVPTPLGNTHPNLAPCDKYTTSTGEIFIAIGNDGQFRKLANTIGCPELADDALFSGNSERVANKLTLYERIQEILKDKDGDKICMELLRQSVPAGPVQTIDSALAAEQTAARGMVLDADGYRGIASPIKFSRAAASLRRTPPMQSQHQDELSKIEGMWK